MKNKVADTITARMKTISEWLSDHMAGRTKKDLPAISFAVAELKVQTIQNCAKMDRDCYDLLLSNFNLIDSILAYLQSMPDDQKDD